MSGANRFDPFLYVQGFSQPIFQAGEEGGRRRGSGGGGEGRAKYERPVLQERTCDEPADGFQGGVSKRDKKPVT
jgi:hypothetical protein